MIPATAMSEPTWIMVKVDQYSDIKSSPSQNCSAISANTSMTTVTVDTATQAEVKKMHCSTVRLRLGLSEGSLSIRSRHLGWQSATRISCSGRHENKLCVSKGSREKNEEVEDEENPVEEVELMPLEMGCKTGVLLTPGRVDGHESHVVTEWKG